MKKCISICLCFVLTFLSALDVVAEGIKYLPDVTKEMSNADFWTKDSELLMSFEKIEAQNALTTDEPGTCMYDLKNQVEFVNTIDLNKALKKSTKADIDYYLGWTYLESDKIAEESDFDAFITNTQKINPKKQDSVLYAVAVKRTHLHTFPSYTAIWDDPEDPECNYQYLTGVRVNEPLVITSVSKDKKFYLAKSICCSGWVPASDVAICKNKAEWLSAWDIPKDKSLAVYGDKVYTQMSVSGEKTSELMLTMGTVLEIADDVDPNELVDNRSAYQNYVVYMPVRNDDGSYAKKLTLISESEKVCHGFLPMTKNNIISVVFDGLGNTYGWGDWLNSSDCSGYIRNVYKCFGLELARNTSWQEAMPMAKADMAYMCREERIRLLKALPAGTILYFNGHEMMYLGCKNEKFYVVSATGSMMQPENPTVRQRIRSIVINTLEVRRANGNTWLDELTTAIIPYETPEKNSLPEYAWYHSGVSFCIKNKIMQGDENKFFNPDKNVTWAEILQILRNMEEDKTENSADKNWYDNAIKWAMETKLICDENIGFLPESAISRQQLASVLYLYAQYKGVVTSVNEKTDFQYNDALNISDYATDALKFLTENNVLKGKTKNTINPNDYATRAETAMILERFVNLIK